MADLKQKLNEDLKKAMKAGDSVGRGTIRLILAAVKNAEIAKQSPLEEGDILGVIAKEAKKREESIIAFKDGGRPELVAQEEAELKVIQGYLPQQMSREEITAATRKVIEDTGAQGIRDKGKVMPLLIAQLKGRADGRAINEVVTELLA